MRFILCGAHRNTLVRAELVRAEPQDWQASKLRKEDLSNNSMKELHNIGSTDGMRRPLQAVEARPEMVMQDWSHWMNDLRPPQGDAYHGAVRRWTVDSALQGCGEEPAEPFLDRVRQKLAKCLEFDV
eukprot:3474840-Amphidinium_carterae.1